MARKSKQEIEQHYFRMFSRDYPLPDGTITHGDKPDVILEGERKIGIEITNLFIDKGELSESEQVQSKARDAVVSEGQRIYLAKSGEQIEFSFGFNKAYPIRDRKTLAKKMAELAMDVDGSGTGAISKEIFKEIPELSSVYLNATKYEEARWHVVQVHSGSVMSVQRLQEIVKTKEAKSRSYRRCDAYWLLVVVDFMDAAQDQEIRIDGFKKIDSTIFEKVIVYKTLFGHVFETK